jgi:iron complex transport system substrate-binding protein
LPSIASGQGQRPATISDAASRAIRIPERVTRVFPAGPPAAILLYTLAPDLLLGWPRANRPQEREFLLPDVSNRPQIGRLTGRGNTANLEVVLALKPDLIFDLGYVDPTYVSLADRVQQQTGIPYALLDGRFAATADSYRVLGALTQRPDAAAKLAHYCATTIDTVAGRASQVPPEHRPRVYYARGPRGLETALAGSINVESVELLGARNVAGERRGGLVTVSMEQVLLWDPDVIVTIDPQFAAGVQHEPGWSSLSAVRAGRVHLAPYLPFGWIDFPPSVNRLIGLWWLAKVFYPPTFPEDLHALTREFYAMHYHVQLTDSQIERVLAGRE